MPPRESAVPGRWMGLGFHVLSLPRRRRLSNGAAFSSGFRSARVQRRVNPRCPTSKLGRLNEGRLLSSWLPSRRAAVTGTDCGVYPIAM